VKAFDKKFGARFVAALPATPAVYRVYDAAGALIYIGKAKNLRRRLGQYRNAKRRKAHFKMRQIVSDARRIEYEACASDLDACLLEARLIQEHRPRWNTAGAFFFLYPLVGVKFEGGITSFCYTTHPESFADFDLHGAYRSRGITGGAFWALVELLAYVGHRVPRDRKREVPKYSHVVRFRQLPEGWMEKWREFLRGDSREAMEWLVLALVENAGARRKGREVQKALNRLRLFWSHEACSLRKVRETLAYAGYPVPQRERDFLYLKRRYSSAKGASAALSAVPAPARGIGEPVPGAL
jgi:predicted GIY-YIG superfamily endonuclease